MADDQYTLDDVHKAFQHRDEYKFLVESLKIERENSILMMGRAVDPFSVGKYAGQIDGLNLAIDMLTPSE